jgi:hypothetical protein
MQPREAAPIRPFQVPHALIVGVEELDLADRICGGQTAVDAPVEERVQ